MATLFEYGQHEDLGGGVFRTTLSPRPVNYLNNGAWQPINNDWVDGDQDSPHIISASALRIRADGAGRRNIYPIPGNDAAYISIGRPWYQPGGTTWAIVPLNPLERVNSRLQSINGNYNLYLDHAGHYAKLGILLKNGFVPPNNRFAFPAELVGLTRQGSNILYNGQVVMKIRPPVVYDWNNPEDVRPITFQFTNFGGQPGVIFNLPSLTGMGLPLVDPTLTLQPDATAGIDTFIQENLATFNFGTTTSIQVGQGGTAGSKRRGLLMFDLSALPPGAVPSVADLTMRCDTEDAATDYVVGAHRALTTWFEGVNAGGTPGAGVDGSTWNLRNHNGSVAWAGGAGGAAGSDWTATATDSKTITAATTFFTWNVLADVQAWLSGTTNNGHWFINTSETTTSSRKNFASSDHATGANRPQLAITYTVGSGGGLFWPGVLDSALFGGAIVR